VRYREDQSRPSRRMHPRSSWSIPWAAGLSWSFRASITRKWHRP